MSVGDESAISSVEAAVLADQEAIIAQGLKTFYAVGTALLTIRDQRLYRQDHSTFEEYCAARWNIARRMAYRLMDAATVVDDVSNWTQTDTSTNVELPQNEAQARPLATLPPDQRAAAWQTAVETAPEGRVTAAHVTATVRDILHPSALEPEEAPFTYPEPDGREWHTAGDDVPTPAIQQVAPEALRPLDTRQREVEEHERAIAGLDRLTGGKIQRDRALRVVENAINTIATQDAAVIAQAADEDTLARTFEASVVNLEQWIVRYRSARADRHRIVSFVQKGA